MLIAEQQRIRRVELDGTISTVAGGGEFGVVGEGGPATEAYIFGLSAVFVDASDSFYFTEQSNHRVRKVDASGTTSHGSCQLGTEPWDGSPS